MTNRIIGAIICLVISLFSFNVASADDGGPNTVYWMENQKDTCVSVTKLEDSGSDHFYLFDYSSRLGEELGKPWAIMEEGKCYEIDDEVNIYRVEIVNGNERQYYSDYSKFEATDDITADDIVGNENITKLRTYKDIGITDSDVINFTGINANDLFPTEYDFGFGITFFVSSNSEEEQEIGNDPSHIEIEELYEDLAGELEDTIKSCDNRIGVEQQLTFNDESFSEENIIWKFDDDKVFAFDKYQQDFSLLDSLAVVDLIGCRDSFGEYIKSHMSDFETIDQLSYEFIDKYPDAGSYFITKRDEASIERILNFVNTDEPIDGYTLSDMDEGMTGISEPDSSMDSAALDGEIEKTIEISEMDEPTREKKVDMIVNSNNILIRLYALLPILSLFGAVIFLIFKRRDK